LAKDPSLRYQSADDLRSDLVRFGQGRDTLGAPPATRTMTGGAAAAGPDATSVLPAATGRATAVTELAGPAPPQRRTGAYIAVLVVLLAVLAALLFLLGRQLGLFSGSSGAQLVIPSDVLGKTGTDAANELK